MLESADLDELLVASGVAMEVLIGFLEPDEFKRLCETEGQARLCASLLLEAEQTEKRPISEFSESARRKWIADLEAIVRRRTMKAVGFNKARAQKNLAELRRVGISLV